MTFWVNRPPNAERTQKHCITKRKSSTEDRLLRHLKRLSGNRIGYIVCFVCFVFCCVLFLNQKLHSSYIRRNSFLGLIVSRHFFKHKQQAAAAHGSSWSLGICYEKSWSRCGEKFVCLLMIIWPVCCITKETFTPTGQKFFSHTPLVAMPSPPPQPDLNYSKFVKKMYT